MNYQLELQKIQIKIDQAEDSEQIRQLLKQAIEIADNHNDLYEGIDLRYQLMDEMDMADERIPILKQAIQLADANQDLQEGFDLRIRLIQEENDTSHCIDSFPAMTWLLEAVDNHPDLFEEEEVLWEYKWLATSSVNNASVSYEQIQKILEDLKFRLERNGYGLGAYYVPKIEWQESIGDIEGALETLKERDAYGRDGMSDCAACEQNKKIKIKLIAGKYEEAIADMNEMQMKKLSCAEVPYDTYCNLAYYLNKANDPRAKEYYEKGLHELGTDSSAITGLSKLINYISYHDPEQALLLFEKYAHWHLNSEDGVNFEVALHFLNLFKKDEMLTLPGLNPSLPFYKAEGKYQSHDLYQYYFNIAQTLAEKFDHRNRTDNYKKMLSREVS